MIDYTFLGTHSDAANNSTYTFSGVSFGSAAPYRFIILSAIVRASASRSITSITIGGTVARVTQTSNNSSGAYNIVAIASALVPAGNTGDIVVALSGTAEAIDIAKYRALDMDSVVPYHSVASSSNNPSAAINVPQDGMVIGVAASTTGSSGVWSNLTEDYELNTESFGTGTGGSVDLPSGQEGPGRTVSVTFGSNFAPILLLASYKKARPRYSGSMLFFF